MWPLYRVGAGAVWIGRDRAVMCDKLEFIKTRTVSGEDPHCCTSMIPYCECTHRPIVCTCTHIPHPPQSLYDYFHHKRGHCLVLPCYSFNKVSHTIAQILSYQNMKWLNPQLTEDKCRESSTAAKKKKV